MDKLVYIIDDNEAILTSLSLFFQSQGIRVIGACDGNTALQRFSNFKEKIGVIVTDLTLPYVSGIALIEEFSYISPDTPIIAMSGYNHFGDVLLQKENVIGYLKKPFDFSKLLELVSSAVNFVDTVDFC